MPPTPTGFEFIGAKVYWKDHWIKMLPQEGALLQRLLQAHPLGLSAVEIGNWVAKYSEREAPPRSRVWDLIRSIRKTLQAYNVPYHIEWFAGRYSVEPGEDPVSD